MDSFILLGCPNCGKTTIFNAITGRKEKVGNWHGVTAKEKKATYISKNKSFELVDLPGIYSLKGYSCEEVVTIDYILKKQYKAIIFIFDTTSAFSSLALLKEVMALNKRVILLFNKVDKGGFVKEKLKGFGVKYYQINPYKNKSVKEFLDNLVKPIYNKKEFSLECFDLKIKPFYDNYLLRWYVLFPLFFSLVFLAFFCAFSNFLGGGVSILLQSGIDKISIGVIGLIKSELLGAIIVKTLGGLGGVLGLLPQIVILQFFLYLLEESGISQRFCVLTYNFLSKLGLSGKSVFPLISALGCGAVSCKACNSCENLHIKNNTLKLIPFVPCSAKNSVFIFICQKTFAKPIIAILLGYFLLVLVSLLYAYFTQRIKRVTQEEMFIELVEICFPSLKRVLVQVGDSTIEFFKKIVSVCLVVTFAIAIFTSITPRFLFASSLEDSLICFLIKKFDFILYPLGLNNWEILLAFTMGLFSKESIISVTCLLQGNNLNFSIYVGVMLIFINFLYPPCLTNIIAFEKEEKHLGIKIFFKHLLIAYFGVIILRF